MDVPNEYNVVNGLLGLGPDIMLEVLNEMTKLWDLLQFGSLCKKTHLLISHSRFPSILEKYSVNNCNNN